MSADAEDQAMASDPDLADLGAPEEPSRSFISRWLSKADRWASRPLTAAFVMGALLALEHASDEELRTTGHKHRRARQDTVKDR